MHPRIKWVLVCVLFVVATAAVAEEAQWLRYPAISPDGKTIVFSYRGDLWRVAATGGTATPLTLHEAHDTQPVWSRDGSTLAFASDRYGNFDTYVMPSEGGPATRLTYHSANDVPTSFAPGDDAVLFVSSRMDSVTAVQYPTRAQPELYSVALDGGMPTQILTTPAMYAVLDSSGTRMIYSDSKGYEDEWRKHDDSSFARDLWSLDVTSGEHTRLTEFGHDDRQPVWNPGERSIHFLSERSGSFNVWRMDLDDPSRPVQVTQYDTHPVRFLSSSSSGDLAYAWDGSLYVQPSGSNQGRRIAVSVNADRRTNEIQHVDVARQITEFEVSPDGKEIAFISRGEVFVTSTGHSATRRVTNTSEQ